MYATNASSYLFEGDYTGLPGATPHSFNFTSNLYWNTADPQFATAQTWGGCDQALVRSSSAGGGWLFNVESGPGQLLLSRQKPCRQGKLTWKQWQQGCGTTAASNSTHCTGVKQDRDSLLADPQFTDPAALDFSLPANSPAYQVGHEGD